MLDRRAPRAGTAALLALVLGAAAACGGTADDGDGSGNDGATAGADSSGSPTSDTGEVTVSPDALVVDVTIEGGQVTPNAERVEAEIGQQIVFRVTSDTTTEIHGHATPEFSWAIEPGSSEHEVTFDEPASVTVETHDPDRTLVQLVVR
ncbi:hypothetical protein RDV89_02825 [Nocardioides zeae]|uniref:EfeO-type cupredoxin-like domain-containing protein n=1 Tax=Nocardioides imazamoxiresistens TaxID=3231893 RepID=A0ABU3PRY8_9ACTN|nr:hypothetical protein [Nocardioides zeae]MDT9591983.1 hypothetical protein [Nocardioides zeae]